MPDTSFRLVWDERALAIWLGGITASGTARAARITQRRVQDNIVAAGRVRTGRMLHSIEVVPLTRTPTLCEMAVGSDVHYTPYQNFGTRRGIRGAHFFEKALAALSTADFYGPGGV